MQTTRTAILRLLAVLLFLATATLWIAGGAHRGWTQTQVTELHLDPITGIEYPVYRDAFVPGIELLGAGLLGAALFGGASLIGSRRKPLPIPAAASPAEVES